MRAATSGGTDGTAAGGGSTVGAAVGPAVGVWLIFGGGVTVVTVSGGSKEAVGGLSCGAGLALRGGTTTVAEVEALSPPLTITTVAITASTKTIPAMAATGRQR